jgi:hypothetical protein
MGSGTTKDTMTMPAHGVGTREAEIDPFLAWRELQDVLDVDARIPVDGPMSADPSTEASAVLDDPRRVLSDGYIGIDRRRAGLAAGLARLTYFPRRKLLRIEVLIVLAVVAMVVGAVLLVTSRPLPAPRTSTLTVSAALGGAAAVRAPALAPQSTPAAAAPPPATPAAVGAAAATAAANLTPATTATTVPDTPDAMGAAALALVRYPWQQLPGYSIVFLPISQAPSPGFYGNTSFSWGQPGGTSTLYVFPGETVDQLAGIIAFEIGHEVDAAYVEPQGGHAQIESLLGIDPSSWAPQCDCAEQDYLSGWYASAFSNYWSPGVGNWSTLAPEPTGATLAAVEPWLDPRVP